MLKSLVKIASTLLLSSNCQYWCDFSYELSIFTIKVIWMSVYICYLNWFIQSPLGNAYNLFLPFTVCPEFHFGGIFKLIMEIYD